MQSLIDKIESLKAALAALQPIAEKDQARLAQKFRLEFNYNSNHIEGNTLTYGETMLLLIHDDTRGDHNLREYEEMKAHDLAYQLIQQWTKDQTPLTEADIKNLNKILLVRPFWKDAETADGKKTRRLIAVGEYKEFPNSVRLANGEMFEYASVIDTPIMMGELMDWLNTESELKTLHPFQLAALYHYKFVRIHPFDDGNGRISRLLMNYILLKNDLPPVVIKSADKKNYLNALHDADVGNLDSFVRYIGNQLVWSLELSIMAAKGESIEEPDDIDKELLLLKRELTDKKVLTLKADTKLVIDAFEQNIIRLFLLTEEKLETIKELFIEYERQIFGEYYVSKGNQFHLETGNDSWERIRSTWLQPEVISAEKRLYKIDYQYRLKGFKGNLNAEQYWISFEVVFEDYNYLVRFNDNGQKTFAFPYGKRMSVDELQNLVSKQLKTLIERIRQASKTENN